MHPGHLRSKRRVNKLSANNPHKAEPGSLERLQYFEQLINEYTETDISDYKEQILANLANFAYDPRNCLHLRQLNVLELFLNCLAVFAPIWSEPATEHDYVHPGDSALRLAEIAVGGIANLAAISSVERKTICDHPQLAYVVAALASPSPSIVINSLTILIHLFTPCPNSDYSPPSLSVKFPAAVKAAQSYSKASSLVSTDNNPLDSRIVVLAQVLLEDCC